MKKIIKSLSIFACLALVLSSCSLPQQSNTSPENTIITVGASVTPHSEILNVAKPLLLEQGYELNIIEYTDYILPNTALSNGEIDANFFQHTPYLNDFNNNNGTDISSALSVHFEPFGIYSDKHDDLSSLPQNATIAVPNDTSNEARALLLLQANGIIELKEGVGIEATVLDIVENPYNVEIHEVEAAQLARILPDVDLACINGNYALQAGLTAQDALVFEDSASISAQTYANILAVNTKDLETEKTKALVNALTSDEVKNYINDNYSGAVVPVF